MKVFNTFYFNRSQLNDYIRKNEINAFRNVLIQVFTGKSDITFVDKIVGEIEAALPGAHIIGSTTAGEIMNCEVFSHSTVISLCAFEETALKTAIIHEDNDSYNMGRRLAKKLLTNETKLMIIFSNASGVNGSDLLAGVDSVGSGFVIAGGHAGNSGYFNSTFTFSNDGATSKGVVGVSLNGKKLNVYNDYSLCWQGIGKIMTVTRSVKNRVYEIDNMTTREVYRKYLGDEVADLLPGSATEFPLKVLREDIAMARYPMALHEDGSMDFGGNIEQGSKVLFSYGNIALLKNRAAELSDMIRKKDLDALFVYSCFARFAFMQDRIRNDLTAIRNVADVSGFFTYGEYFQTTDRKNVLLNITTTLLGLSEKEERQSGRKGNTAYNYCCVPEFVRENFLIGKKEIIVKVFTNLVNAVTGDLEEINKNLERKNLELIKLNNQLEKYARTIQENQSVLIEMEKSVNQSHVIAGIAHNLKTPIMTISGEVSLLRELLHRIEIMTVDLPNAGEFKGITTEMEDWLSEIKACLEYMSEVIQTVKDQSRGLAGYSQKLFSIEELIRKVNVLMMHELKKCNCELKTEIRADRLLKIPGNINDLIQVLNILIANAIDSYLGKGGIIELKLCAKINMVTIHVTDYGIGIKKEIIQKIFKEMVTTKGKNGTGLGLYMAYPIIKGKFRGDIAIKSAMGLGTTVKLSIPTN